MRYYCQYHHGGFRTYRIEGVSNELLDKIVSSEHRYDLPLETEKDINNNGLKLVYRQIGDDTLSLTVRNIPSLKTDTAGKPIESSLVIIGDLKKDRSCFEALVGYYVNNREGFDDSIRMLFSLRGGLHIEGDKLVALVDSIKDTSLNYGQNINFLETRDNPFVCTLPLLSNKLEIKIAKKDIPQLTEDTNNTETKDGIPALPVVKSEKKNRKLQKNVKFAVREKAQSAVQKFRNFCDSGSNEYNSSLPHGVALEKVDT